MKETSQNRISQLQTRKAQLKGQMKTLRENPNARNKEHKLDRLNEQVLTITEKIIKVRDKCGKN
jgi:chromosome segregation ATPase